MKKSFDVIAADLGASSGKVFCGSFADGRIELNELHRFPNAPVTIDGHLCWDSKLLFKEVLQGISVGEQRFNPASISVDTWGHDIVLMSGGSMLYPQRCYRDFAQSRALEEIYRQFSRTDLFKRTGTLPHSKTTLVQLIDMPGPAGAAQELLFTPDWFNYCLSGQRATDFTIASTSMMLGQDGWDSDICKSFGATRLVPRLVKSGTVLGSSVLSCISNPLQVVTAAGHDTACAFAAVPDQDNMILASGTWSLMGVVTDKMVTSDEAMQLGLSNQRAADGRNRLQCGFSALWIMQQCVGEWQTSYDDAEALAQKSTPFRSLINPANDAFYTPGSMTEKINAYLRSTGQPTCETRGDFVRCIYESLAFKYAQIALSLQAATHRGKMGLTIVGGGVKSVLLDQMTANAIAMPVKCGSSNGSALGNCLVQLVALKEIGWEDCARVAENSVTGQVFTPVMTQQWEEQKPRFAKLP